MICEEKCDKHDTTMAEIRTELKKFNESMIIITEKHANTDKKIDSFIEKNDKIILDPEKGLIVKVKGITTKMNLLMTLTIIFIGGLIGAVIKKIF